MANSTGASRMISSTVILGYSLPIMQWWQSDFMMDWSPLIGLIGIWLVFLVLAYLVARKNKFPVRKDKTAKGTLDERYAREELTTEEVSAYEGRSIAGRLQKDERTDDRFKT